MPLLTQEVEFALFICRAGLHLPASLNNLGDPVKCLRFNLLEVEQESIRSCQ